MNVIDRFLHYVSFSTASDERSEAVPSTKNQLVLAHALCEELKELGIGDAVVDEFGRVYGHLSATPGHENDKTYGLIAHMDTSPDASGENVKPRQIAYAGGDIVLNEAEHIVMRAADFPILARYTGKSLIVTDGTTLLGADDKAGVAEIMTAVEHLIAHPELPHGPISIAFTPDEEIGSGADHFDHPRFHADYAFTVDGGTLGEVEYENFNAANAGVKIHGRNIHPGSAKNIMKNAVLLAAEFISLLPPAEAPAHTEGYEGFYHVTDISGNETEVVLHAIIRDHDREKFEARKTFVENAVRYLNGVWGEGSFWLELKDSYYNMKEKLLPHMELIDNACAAMRAVGVEPEIVPIRGGTDGARLSWERDIPCPNLCTGGANFHGVHEFVPVASMEKMVQVLVELVRC